MPARGSPWFSQARRVDRRAPRARRPRRARRPGSASRRTSASAIGPSLGETHVEPRRPTTLLAEPDLGAAIRRLGQPQAAQVAVRLAPVMKARDRLLAHVAPLGEAHGALVDAGLLRHRVGVHVEAEPRPAGLDAHALRRLLRDGLDVEGRAGLADHVHAEQRRDVDAVLAGDEGVLVSGRSGVELLARGRADEREERARLGHVLELHVAAERVGAQHVGEHGVTDRLRVEPEPVVAAQDAEVGCGACPCV